MVHIICGEKGSGKTTFANSLGLPIYSFATPVKEYTDQMFNELYCEELRDYDKELVRPFYVLLANWARENIHPDFWVDKLLNSVEGEEDFVIDDCRFLNELTSIQNLYGDDCISYYLEPFNGKKTDGNEVNVKQLRVHCDIVIEQ